MAGQGYLDKLAGEVLVQHCTIYVQSRRCLTEMTWNLLRYSGNEETIHWFPLLYLVVDTLDHDRLIQELSRPLTLSIRAHPLKPLTKD